MSASPPHPVTAPPAAGASDPGHYQHERYLSRSGAHPAVEAFYAVKPLIPRRVQLALRRAYAGRQAARAFPAWPIEPILVDGFRAGLRAGAAAEPDGRLAIVGLWPAGHTSACIITHDVEGPAGIENIDRLLELEGRHGLRSSWNFVAEDYPIPPGTFERIRAAGCEIGLHGINHDGKLFATRARFEHDLPKIHAYLEHWGAVGFRSPATRRNAEWMHELGCEYDSSFPDTDPFEPQPGGCCSILPFLFGDVVELPLTLAQDHTLWEILRQDSIEIWRRKSDWIVANHGLVNVNIHPDYVDTPSRLAMYERLLEHLAGAPGAWQALPREVAAWWKARTRMECERSEDGAQITGDAHGEAVVWWVPGDGGHALGPEPEGALWPR